MKQHWYRITTLACPVCGGGETIRERIYGPRPEDPCDRYVYDEVYDYCLEWGSM